MLVTFRTATGDDVAIILTFMQRFYALDGYPFDETAARAAVERLIQDKALGTIWLITRADAILGYLVLTLGYSLEYHGRDAFIDELYLEPEHRGQGIGTRTLAFVEAECRARGIQALHLEVERTNQAAQALYRKWAFDDHDRLLMTKWIAPA